MRLGFGCKATPTQVLRSAPNLGGGHRIVGWKKQLQTKYARLVRGILGPSGEEEIQTLKFTIETKFEHTCRRSGDGDVEITKVILVWRCTDPWDRFGTEPLSLFRDPPWKHLELAYDLSPISKLFSAGRNLVS